MNFMKRKLTRLLMLGCLLTAGCLNSLAQEKEPMPEKARLEKKQVEALFKVLAAKPAVGKIVKGAPYSATATAETIQTLSDGNQIIRRNESKMYRDSEGRTRTEQTLETIGKWKADGEARPLITINDPAVGVAYSLDPRTRTAQKNVYWPQKPATFEWREGFTVNGKAVTKAEFETLQEKIRTKPPANDAPQQIIPSKDAKAWELQKGVSGDPRKKIEQLGKQMIEGVETVGTRSTYTIPAGEIGNTLPIEVVEETWYSPELQLMVLTRSRDPRSGQTNYRLTNLQRNEPDRSLFEVPANYTVRENNFPQKPKPIKEEE